MIDQAVPQDLVDKTKFHLLHVFVAAAKSLERDKRATPGDLGVVLVMRVDEGSCWRD